MTDGEIIAALNTGEIEITPIGSRAEQIQPCSVDLRLGREVMRYARVTHPNVRLGEPMHRFMEGHDYGVAKFFKLEPGEFALGVTMERVKLPSNILGRVEGRSSIGRVGLFVHITAGFIDPGFDGRITLEFFNGAPRAVEIPFGFRVCQLALQRLAQPCVRPYGEKRGSKYVGAAAASVEPARAEQPAWATKPRIADLLKSANPPGEIAHECVNGCAPLLAQYKYDWRIGRGWYECVTCGTHAEDT